MANTPMMEQYEKLKARYVDAILLFRLGDFYEAFNDDAKEISKILNLTLTGRGQGENRIPMAGIPYHALPNYLRRLVKAGKKVAIAEQMEEPQAGKIVEREVTKIITAGTVTDENSLDESSNNYLVALFKEKNGYYLAYADLTTAEFRTATFISKGAQIPAKLKAELFRLDPKELLVARSSQNTFTEFSKVISLQPIDDDKWDLKSAFRCLTDHFQIESMKSFGYEANDKELIPAAIIIDYLSETQRTSPSHIVQLTKLPDENYMQLDPSTISNLELIWPLNSNSPNTTLFGILNKCYTAMGQRKLRSFILNPLTNISLINERLAAVEELFNEPQLIEQVQTELDNICDLERVVAKIGIGSVNARDLIFLKSSILGILNLFNHTSSFKSEKLNYSKRFGENRLKLQSIVELLEGSLHPDPPVTIMEGGIIKAGYNSELDEIKSITTEGDDWLKNLQTQEIERTSISSLKIKFNSVFGYYIEVSKSNLDKVPENYIRKQTLVNAERFITEELKHWESKILNAQERANNLEYELFVQIREEVAKHIPLLLEIAEFTAGVDVFSDFASIARSYDYVKPEFVEENIIDIKDGRHPVVERFSQSQYVPNDVALEDGRQQVVILTGPNMSGKSTFIRQVALNVLMAQIGSFVPAASARLGVVDRIFTRVGASDNLAAGQSTFMIEMNETANILNNASERSLVILDEVGRGTSTYDGVAIAWAIVEYINEKLKAKTLFATHYHELIGLENKHEGIKNFNVEVIENKGDITFTHKIVPGGTDQSYGVHVAKMAGVPAPVVKRANAILSALEEENTLDKKNIKSLPKPKRISKNQLELI